MKTAKLNGVELQYDITGSGDPALLISTGPIADSFLPFVAEKVLAGHPLVRDPQRRMAARTPNPAPVPSPQPAAPAAALLGPLRIPPSRGAAPPPPAPPPPNTA